MGKLIAIDLDGTLVNGAEAIEGARKALGILHENGHKIMIFTCNNKDWAEIVLRNHDIWFDYIWPGEKPVWDLLIDDRNVVFDGDWPKALEETLKRVE